MCTYLCKSHPGLKNWKAPPKKYFLKLDPQISTQPRLLTTKHFDAIVNQRQWQSLQQSTQQKQPFTVDEIFALHCKRLREFAPKSSAEKFLKQPLKKKPPLNLTSLVIRYCWQTAPQLFAMNMICQYLSQHKPTKCWLIFYLTMPRIILQLWVFW